MTFPTFRSLPRDVKAHPDATRSRDTGLTNLWRFAAALRPYRIWLVAASVAGLVRMVLPLYMPTFMKNVINVLTVKGFGPEHQLRQVWAMLPLFGVILVLHAIATMGRVYVGQIAATNAVRDIRYQLFDHVQRLSLEFHSTRPTGGIISRVMNDVAQAQGAFDLLFIQAAQQVLNAVVISVYLFWRDWQWALVSLATVPIFTITTSLVKGHIRKASRQLLETNSRISGHLTERMSMVREVQSFTAEDYETRRVKAQVRVLKGYTLRQQFLNALLLMSSEVTRNLGLTITLVFGAYRVLNGHAQVGDVAAFYLYVGMMLNPVEFFANLYANLQSSAAAADRVFEFFDATSGVKDVPGAKALQVKRPPTLRFENVSFAYPDEPEKLILKGVSIDIQSGWRVVLVGGSGSGKSTLMHLLLRFYDPTSGRVLIGEQDIRSVTTQSVRQAIGIVPQSPALFRGTVRDNILYGRRDATEEEVFAAARSANAEEFILALPDGFNTFIGERGVGLSGGQIQRIAIARAFLKDPAILVLDEATSNLDARSERLVLEALDRLAQGRTTFIIAHRLQVARTADLIVDMQDGEIIEQGIHADLIRDGQAYRKLWEQQMAGVMAYE